ncbi:MAG: hypothetical protein MJ186_05460 [Clostridia bacterium]|nr:hypothetical protein [Clostridia bacterium]
MSFDIVNDILKAESDGKAMQAEAEAAAVQAVAEAEKAGRKFVDEELQRAAEEGRKLVAEAEEKGRNAAAVIGQDTDKEIETIRSGAGAKMAAAVEEVVKKVVNG